MGCHAFILCVTACVYMCSPFCVQMYTTRAGKDVLEAQTVHKCWPLLLSVSLVLLFLSRAVYNIVAVRISDISVFGDGSTFTTDMVSRKGLCVRGAAFRHAIFCTSYGNILLLISAWASPLPKPPLLKNP